MDYPTKSLAFLLALFFSACFGGSATLGLDWDKYFQWSQAILAGNVFAIDTDQLGPLGLPFFQWSPAPGILLLPFTATLGNFVSEARTMELAGIFYGFLFWSLFFAALRELSNSTLLSTLGLLVAFLCTPIGYYSRVISSETLSLVPLTIVMFQTARLLRRKPICWWTIGCSTSVLLMIRPYCAVYTWPVLIAGQIWMYRNKQAKRLQSTLICSLPIAVGLAQLCCAFWFATGNPFRSPYSFGDSEFSSLTLGSPAYLWNVWFDTFHGLLPVFPFVAVGLGLLLLEFVSQLRLGNRLQAAMWALMVLAIFINGWFQGSWYYWWMGEQSFAMRGLALVGIPVTFGFIATWERLPSARPALSIATTLCGIWSWLHLRQDATGYLSWDKLLEGQFLEFQSIHWENWFIACLVALMSWHVAKSMAASNPSCGCVFLIATLSGTSAAYLFQRAMMDTELSLVFFLLAVVLFIAARRFRMKLPLPKLLKSAMQPRLVALACFGLICASYLPFAVITSLKCRYVDSENGVWFHQADALRAWQTLDDLAAHRAEFADQAKRLGDFLRRSGAEVPIASPKANRARGFTYADVKKRKMMQTLR